MTQPQKKRPGLDRDFDVERIAGHVPGLVFTYTLQPDGTYNPSLLEMRDPSSGRILPGKLFARANRDGQFFRCPTCKQEYLLSHEEYDRVCAAVTSNGGNYYFRCTHCRDRSLILTIGLAESGQLMIIVELKRREKSNQ